ncbi:MAG: uracil-DNA glycosylase [Marinoscillum sp.]|nr:uracil-DNA glycosylase [Marinoscillum sp.]OUX26205.1 MAG: uracil-DNA glycosylase [Flammeovirgaceae bacterium TMED262]|tara:strand:- start:4619 stop:5281 length:663 start_codon:yes stop_codon:yes gene_type:complete
MRVKIEESWNNVLEKFFNKDYFKLLVEKVRNEYKFNTIYPKGDKIFNAFNLCPFDSLKVVIIGQDPYHGKGQANGLSFSVEKNIKIPPSLKNIFIELKNNYPEYEYSNGDLTRWANQGVLLLNSILTVRKSEPGSHTNIGWEKFTDFVIKNISSERRNVVFLLWGKYAQSKSRLIDDNKHLILKSPHPSPFSAHKGFFKNFHFKKTNEYLLLNNIKKINW